MTSFEIFDFLNLFFWSITYLFVIYKSFKYKRCVMPFICLCLNLSWEYLRFALFFDVFSFNFTTVGILTWLILDVIIFVLSFKFHNYKNSKKTLDLQGLLYKMILFSFIFTLTYFYIKSIENGILSLSFSINIIMSLYFLIREIKNRKEDLISVYLFKFLGTGFASAAYGVIGKDILIVIMGGVILFIDIVTLFIALLNLKKMKHIK